MRIKSRDGLKYLGMVTAGPFAEPDSLRADSHLLVTVTARGGIYLPPYHGRLQVAILGQEMADKSLAPPRLRPLPNSPVVALNDDEAGEALRTAGDIRLGCVVGYRNVMVNVPSQKKAVLPRHLAILGTTGGGKSTTVARLIQQAQAAGMAVILLDVEGEYTQIHQPADDDKMLTALRERGLPAVGVPADSTTLYHLVGRDTTNPDHPRRREFSLQFARLSPYAIMEILDLTDAQRERFMNAYDIAKEVMRDLGIFPAKHNAEQERMAAELDEFDRGYPRLTLSLLLDVVGACHAKADRPPKEGGRGRAKAEEDAEPCDFRLYNTILASTEGVKSLRTRMHAAKVQGNVISWRALLGKLGRLNRLKVFHNDKDGPPPLQYKQLLRPGNVSVVDLSDSGASELNNLVIADLLHGVQDAQDEAYAAYEKAAAGSTRPAARAHHHRRSPRIPERRTDRQDANPVRAGFDDRAARPQALAEPGIRHAAAAAPAAANLRPGQLVHPAQNHRPAGRARTAADGERHRRVAVGPADWPGAGPGDREFPAPGPAAAGGGGPVAVQAADGGLIPIRTL